MEVNSIQPFGFPGANKGLLSVIRPFPGLEKQKTLKNGEVAVGISVPVLPTEDIHHNIETNNRRSTKNAQIVIDGDNLDNNASLDLLEDEMEVDTEPIRFVKLNDFLPSNLQQQLTTVCVRGLPVFKKSALERVLIIILLETFDCWSTIESNIIENRLVFIRINSIENVSSALAAFKEVSTVIEGLEVSFDQDALEYVQIDTNEGNERKLEKDGKEEKEEKVNTRKLEQIKRILKNPKNKLKSLKSGTEDLDEVMSYYQTYTVDPAELVDVSNDMKQTIVKDIIKFRSKVLEIERQRRKLEIEEERKKVKEKLKRLFESSTSTSSTTLHQLESTTLKYSLELKEEMQFEDIGDDEYETLIYKRQKIQRDQLYETELSSMVSLENKERKTLVLTLASLVNYENDLMDNKSKYLEEFSDYKHSANPRIKLYFNNFAEYLKRRVREKAEEETKDAEDVAKEAEEVEESTKPATISIKPVNKSINENTKGSSIPANNVKLGSLSADKLSSINGKIGDLLEEYLGLREESLIEFVFQYLLDHNLLKKDELVAELVETLDDDAQTVVDELWQFINGVI